MQARDHMVHNSIERILMMSLQFLKPAFVCLMLAIGVPFSAQVQAHGGPSKAEEDICKLQVGPYSIHFTGYQPDSTPDKEFCEDIPATGRTVVVLDYIEEELRSLPAEVRVIRDTGSEQDLQAITVFHMPPQVYPNGSVTFEYIFDKPGKFVGLVTVGGKQEHVARFPFSVGEPKVIWLYIMAALAALASVVAIFFFGSSGKRG